MHQKSAIESLLAAHHNDAFLWALQCCRYNRDDAKDVLQMVYLKMMEGKATYNEKAAFKTWLFSVIRYTAIDFGNNQKTFTSLDTVFVAEEPVSFSEEINYKKLLLQLPERQQQILLLAFYHHMTLTAIAETTGLHIGTVRTHYERGKTALREIIQKVAI